MLPARVALYVIHREVAGMRGSVRHPRPVRLCSSTAKGGGTAPPSGVGALHVISARSVQFGIHGSVRHLWPVGGARPPEGWVALYAIYRPGGGSALRAVSVHCTSSPPAQSGLDT